MTAGELHHLVARFEDAPCPRDDFLPACRERDVGRRPLDELHAEGLLELLQLRGESRLAHEAARRRAPEVTLVGHGHEGAQGLQLQLHTGLRYMASIGFIKSIDWNYSRESPSCRLSGGNPLAPVCQG